MNTRTIALAAMAAIAGLTEARPDVYTVRQDRVHRFANYAPLPYRAAVGGGRPTTPSKARQVKIKRRAKGRHA